MLLKLANSKKILFFGGKGGVGKTTVSAATAAACADSGAKVLLVSTDPAHNLGHLFDRNIGGTPTRISAGLDALELDPQETVNLAKDAAFAEELARHRNILSGWMEKTDDKGQYPESVESLAGVYRQWRGRCVNPEYDEVKKKYPAPPRKNKKKKK